MRSTIAAVLGLAVVAVSGSVNAGSKVAIDDMDRAGIATWIHSDEFSRQVGVATKIDGLGPVEVDGSRIVVEGISNDAYVWKVDFHVRPMTNGSFDGVAGEALVSKRTDGQRDFFVRDASFRR